jgi:threonine dehydratase
MRCVPTPAEKGSTHPERANFDAVRHLGRRFASARVREVPLLRAAELDQRADPTGSTRVWLALEALQVTGSFHVRGALVALERIAATAKDWHIVAPSAGNHGVAVAYAACVLGMSATVVVPRTTARTKREKIERYGAELVVAATDLYRDAEALASEMAFSRGAAFVAPGADVDLVTANGGSLGIEIVRALGRVPERVLAPMGDGGLATGLAWAFSADAHAHPDRAVWGVHPEARWTTGVWLDSEDPANHIDADAPTLAEELGPGMSAEGMAQARASLAGIVVAQEAEIAAAMAHAYHDMGIVLEGSAAVALAPVLFGLPAHVRGGNLVVVLTARNVDPERLDAVLVRASLATTPKVDDGSRHSVGRSSGHRET